MLGKERGGFEWEEVGGRGDFATKSIFDIVATIIVITCFFMFIILRRMRGSSEF
jgi:hypothetical protein